MLIKLRDYQDVGVSDIRSEFRFKNDPVLFVLSTGGGKTYTFSYIAQSAADMGNPVIIIVHRKELLLQASKSLTDLGIAHGMISPHFTPDPSKRVQVASVDTLLIRMKKQKYNFKLAVFDEAHHVVGNNKWGRAWELLGKPKTLGVTATPVRADGKGLGAHCGGIFKSMVLGPSITELIDRGMLLNPIVITSVEVPDFSDMKPDKDGNYNQEEAAFRVDKPKITGSAVEHYAKLCAGQRAIVFCVNIQHAKHVVDEFNAAGFKFALLVGAPEMKDTERTNVNKALRNGELHGAVTVDLVSEGYDLPDLVCCIMLRPTASEGLYLQQVGRIMRPSVGKMGCFLLDHVGNVGRLVDGSFVPKHGLPNQVREWSLDGRKKRTKKPNEKGIKLKQCPECFMVFEPEPFCPACGHEMPVPKGRDLETVEGTLTQVTPEMAAQLKMIRQREVGQARTLPELEAYAAKMGYTKGWAWHTFNARKKKTEVKKAPEPQKLPLLDLVEDVLKTEDMTLEELMVFALRTGRDKAWAEQIFNEHQAAKTDA